MRTLALLAVSALAAGALFTSLTDGAFAQNDPDILKRIAEEAQAQIEDQIRGTYDGYDAAPPQVKEEFELGGQQVVLLGESLESSDVEEARGHFLSAMRHFKEITRMIAPRAAEEGTASPAQAADRDPLSELNRLVRYVDSLRQVSDRHDTGISFGGIDSLIDRARSEITHGTGNPAATVDQIRSLIQDIKKDIREHASSSASDRARQFVERQLGGIDERITGASDAGADPSQIGEARGLIDEIRTMMAGGEIEDAKRLLRELIQLARQIESSAS